MTWFICRKGYGTRPIFLRLKGINFLLPVADDLDCYRLDTACRKTFGNLAPQKGRQLIADNTIEDATRLLCVDLIHINGSRMLDSFFDRMRCDFMKGKSGSCFLDRRPVNSRPDAKQWLPFAWSGSVARYILSAFLARVFSSLMRSPFPRMLMYLGSKS